MYYTKSIRICVLWGTLFGALCVLYNTNPLQRYNFFMILARVLCKKVFTNTNFCLFLVFGDTFCLFLYKIAENGPKMNQKKIFRKIRQHFHSFL